MTVEVIKLHRGGALIKTPCGCLQVGAPSETIKDSLGLIGDVPETFVIPNRLFSPELGVSLADLEFPVYYNFFIKGRPIRLIGTHLQLEAVFKTIKEAILGPEKLLLSKEFQFGINREFIPNLRAEMEYLRANTPLGERKAEIKDMAIGIPWGPDNRVAFGDMALERTKDTLRVVDGARVIAEVPLDITYNGLIPKNAAPEEKPFEPPVFGITVIGSGSGFDADEMTSGFIVWVNKRGVLVDPPVDSTRWLHIMNIHPKLIDRCILTHSHADHDSGILQKLIEADRINLYTTETVMQSFARKYEALTSLSHKAFTSLFHFHPITIGVPMRINGAEFRFFYTLHSVPTIGFEVFFQGKSFVYSSDSLYDPPTIKKLFSRGDVNRSRMLELINFPWHHPVIFHEAGVPPLHTPMQNLVNLPEDVKKRIYLIHVAQKSIPNGSGLKKAPDGRQKTLIINVSPPPSNEALEYLDVLNHIDLFSELPIEKAYEFLTLVECRRYKANECILSKDTVADRFFMVASGRVRVEDCDKNVVRYCTNNDYFGEASMILNSPSSENIIAETDTRVLSMRRYDFFYFLRGSEIARKMKVVAQNRAYGARALLEESPMFKNLSLSQQTQLQGIMSRVCFKKGEVIAVQGALRENFILVDAGVISLRRFNELVGFYKRGSFLNKIYGIPKRGVNRFMVAAEEDSVVYSFDIIEFYSFLEKNPGIFLFMRESHIRDALVEADTDKKQIEEFL